MTDSEFDEQLIKSFAEGRQFSPLWPKVRKSLSGGFSWTELILPAVAASSTLFLLHARWSGELQAAKQPEPVAMILLTSGQAKP